MKLHTAIFEACLVFILFALFITPFIILSSINISSYNSTLSQTK